MSEKKIFTGSEVKVLFDGKEIKVSNVSFSTKVRDDYEVVTNGRGESFRVSRPSNTPFTLGYGDSTDEKFDPDFMPALKAL